MPAGPSRIPNEMLPALLLVPEGSAARGQGAAAPERLVGITLQWLISGIQMEVHGLTSAGGASARRQSPVSP